MNQIIFIEGVSGVGKTTITTSLCDELANKGCKVNCFLEGSDSNPLDPFNGTYPPPMPLIQFSQTYLRCWHDYIDSQINADSILILDGTFLHHQINDLIQEYNATDEVIANHLNNLICVIQQMMPIVFYLSSGDVERCLIQARISRSQSIPTDENIAFLKNRKRVDMYVLERLSVESHIVDIDNGWNTVVETLVEHISF